MSRTFKIFIVVALIAIGMIATNPSEEEFINKAKTMIKSKIEEKSDSSLSSNLVSGLFDLLGDEVIDLATERKDYTFFSVYTVKIPEEGTRKFLGIFGVFIPLDGKTLSK